MNLRNSFIALATLSIFYACSDNHAKQGEVNSTSTEDSMSAAGIGLTLIADNITSPVGLGVTNDGTKRLFILEQPGKIRIIKNGQLLPTPFLDVTSRMVKIEGSYTERGLLGIAFHPDFKNNGRFFIYYSAPTNEKDQDHKSIIEEYKADAGSDVANATPVKKILEIQQPEWNHNGGCLVFGPDGYLYISVGDGGGAGDKHGKMGNGQNLETLLGKILRIDINKGNPYSIPADNPFVNKPGRDEIYAYGLRNPWRFSFDKQTGKLFCGDVGQNKYEEIDIIEKGKNYGWRGMEGTHTFDEDVKVPGAQPPIHDYDREIGFSVCGGYVYRGTAVPELAGKYIFADWGGRVFSLTENNGTWTREEILFKNTNKEKYGRINSMGEDEDGNIYFLTQTEVGGKNPSGKILLLSRK